MLSANKPETKLSTATMLLSVDCGHCRSTYCERTYFPELHYVPPENPSVLDIKRE